MRLYFAGNFTVTDEVVNEQTLEKILGENYHRLCTFFYPKAADVIIQNIKLEIKKKIKIDETELNTNNHPALQTALQPLQTKLGEGLDEKNQEGYQKEQENRKRHKDNKRKTKKRIKLRKRKSTNKILQ